MMGPGVLEASYPGYINLNLEGHLHRKRKSMDHSVNGHTHKMGLSFHSRELHANYHRKNINSEGQNGISL